MTLVIQRAEHRDTQAIHAKLDEILHAMGDARNELTKLDEEEPEEIERSANTCARTTRRRTGRAARGGRGMENSTMTERCSSCGDTAWILTAAPHPFRTIGYGVRRGNNCAPFRSLR